MALRGRSGTHHGEGGEEADLRGGLRAAVDDGQEWRPTTDSL
jgi:hypothetical protein